MSEPNNEEKSGNQGKGWLATRNRRLAATFAAATIAVAGVFGVQAMAESKTYRHIKTATAESFHGDWHGWRGHRTRFSEMSETEIEDRVERMVKHVSIEIDATDEQEAKLIELVTSAVREMRPIREEMQRSRRELRDLLTAETIDREAIDRLRSERLADFERVSKNLIGTLADAAEVLTPEQRELLEERINEFRSKRGGWRRG